MGQEFLDIQYLEGVLHQRHPPDHGARAIYKKNYRNNQSIKRKIIFFLTNPQKKYKKLGEMLGQ